MAVIEQRLEELGLVLPAKLSVSPDVKLPFSKVRVVGNTAYVAGHGPQNPDGTTADPRGKLGADLTIEQGYEAARLVALSMIASLKRELGDLDRIQAWAKLFGMVNCTPNFDQTPAIINGASDLIIEVFGHEVGGHARSAVGMASLPFGIPVEIEGVVIIK